MTLLLSIYLSLAATQCTNSNTNKPKEGDPPGAPPPPDTMAVPGPWPFGLALKQRAGMLFTHKRRPRGCCRTVHARFNLFGMFTRLAATLIQALWIWGTSNTLKDARCAHSPGNTP